MRRMRTGKNLLNSPFLSLLVRVTQLLSDPWSREVKKETTECLHVPTTDNNGSSISFYSSPLNTDEFE